MEDDTLPEDAASDDAPTRAVALRYERGTDPAPRIAAKGQGTMAAQIIKVAEAHGITIRQDRDLVQVLDTLDIDAVIPLEAYAAVAEILSYIYKANARAGGAHRIIAHITAHITEITLQR